MDHQLLNVDRNQPLYPNFQNCCPDSNCKVTLRNQELWTKFHSQGTEMIITKCGRRMFPSLNVQIQGLEPRGRYCIFLEMAPASRCRHKYTASGGWTPAGIEEAQSHLRTYLHPDSPATGEFWMSQPVSFGRMKLTNAPTPPAGQVVLSSMHKYQPTIIIATASDPRVSSSHHNVIVFPETSFIAVTAYQNEKITQLKIDNNPFAKGFRENGQSKCKRKRSLDEDSGVDKTIVKQAKVLPSQKVDNNGVSSVNLTPQTCAPLGSAAMTPSISPGSTLSPEPQDGRISPALGTLSHPTPQYYKPRWSAPMSPSFSSASSASSEPHQGSLSATTSKKYPISAIPPFLQPSHHSLPPSNTNFPAPICPIPTWPTTMRPIIFNNQYYAHYPMYYSPMWLPPPYSQDRLILPTQQKPEDLRVPRRDVTEGLIVPQPRLAEDVTIPLQQVAQDLRVSEPEEVEPTFTDHSIKSITGCD